MHPALEALLLARKAQRAHAVYSPAWHWWNDQVAMHTRNWREKNTLKAV